MFGLLLSAFLFCLILSCSALVRRGRCSGDGGSTGSAVDRIFPVFVLFSSQIFRKEIFYRLPLRLQK